MHLTDPAVPWHGAGKRTLVVRPDDRRRPGHGTVDFWSRKRESVIVKILIPCMECALVDDNLYPVEVGDDFVLSLTCDKGHVTATCLQEHRFEILYEIGVNAIVDGYYREAISAFQSCLERFYEFYLSVIAIKRGISEDVWASSWKIVAQQSERQLGAFIYVYCLENKTVPPLLDSTLVKLRNDVVHKGKLPQRVEAIRYGNAVIAIVNPLLQRMKQVMKEHLSVAVNRNILKSLGGVPVGAKPAFMCTASTISVALSATEPHVTSIEARLDRLTRARQGSP